jgi:hypothetical protein
VPNLYTFFSPSLSGDRDLLEENGSNILQPDIVGRCILLHCCHNRWRSDV